MSESTDFRDAITDLVTNFGSTVVITPRTPTTGNYGGYEPGSDGDGTAVSTLGIPSNYLTSKSTESFGKLKEGEVMIVMRYSDTIAKGYKITYASNDYSIEEIKEVRMQDTIVGYRVKLSRKID